MNFNKLKNAVMNMHGLSSAFGVMALASMAFELISLAATAHPAAYGVIALMVIITNWTTKDLKIVADKFHGDA